VNSVARAGAVIGSKRAGNEVTPVARHHGSIERAALDNTSPALARGWHAVARASEVVDTPVQVWLLGHPWVLSRLDGVLTAFADRCPHRFAPLSAGSVVGDTLRCGYHGWRFGPGGRAVAIPANEPGVPIPPRACLVPAAAVQERFGLVWLAPQEPVCAVHEFPEWDDPTFARAETRPRRTPVSALQLADNFLDAAHFPTVHTRTFGTPEAAYVSPHHVSRDGWEIRTVYEAPYRNHDDPLVATGEHPLVQPHVLTKVGRPPSSVYLTLDFPLTGERLAILFVCQPETATSTRVYKLMAHNGCIDDPARVAEFVGYEDLVLDEDLAVLERYDAMTLATDPRREVQTVADKLSVAYRRVLADLADVADREASR
jgi:phenylpropionate dioxygenase-like ring-hydroxylating dioxygenase large terminal subunit